MHKLYTRTHTLATQILRTTHARCSPHVYRCSTSNAAAAADSMLLLLVAQYSCTLRSFAACNEVSIFAKWAPWVGRWGCCEWWSRWVGYSASRVHRGLTLVTRTTRMQSDLSRHNDHPRRSMAGVSVARDICILLVVNQLVRLWRCMGKYALAVACVCVYIYIYIYIYNIYCSRSSWQRLLYAYPKTYRAVECFLNVLFTIAPPSTSILSRAPRSFCLSIQLFSQYSFSSFAPTNHASCAASSCLGAALSQSMRLIGCWVVAMIWSDGVGPHGGRRILSGRLWVVSRHTAPHHQKRTATPSAKATTVARGRHWWPIWQTDGRMEGWVSSVVQFRREGR